MHSAPRESPRLGALRNTGHSCHAVWGERSGCRGRELAAWRGDRGAGRLHRAKRRARGCGRGAGKEGPSWTEEEHEQTHRGMEGNAGSGNGVDLGCTEVRRQVVGDEGRGQGMEKADQEEQTLRSDDSAWFPVTVST